MAAYIRWLRLGLNILLFLIMGFAAVYYETTIYIFRQAAGQWHIMRYALTIQEYTNSRMLSIQERDNLKLIDEIKKFSVNKLGYKNTGNFTTIYNQKNKPILWVVTASEKFSIQPYNWCFPITGCVSYKGFFSESLAVKEKNRLLALGFDAGIRSVSAWSTLGWLNDPLLSDQLSRNKGSFCNLLFHELFHATMYNAGKVDDNENVANFIADKATQLFLNSDSVALNQYLEQQKAYDVLSEILQSLTDNYRKELERVREHPHRLILKQEAILRVTRAIKQHPGISKEQKTRAAKEILNEQNAFFIDYLQYYSKQDSLENLFNNFYKGNLKLMVQSLSE
jgi:predicted aminopeptidase